MSVVTGLRYIDCTITLSHSRLHTGKYYLTLTVNTIGSIDTYKSFYNSKRKSSNCFLFVEYAYWGSRHVKHRQRAYIRLPRGWCGKSDIIFFVSHTAHTHTRD